MNEAADLGIYAEVPFLDKVQRAVNTVVYVLFANQISLLLWDLVYIIALSLIVSQGLRAAVGNTFFRIILILILFGFYLVWGYFLYQKIVPWYSRLIFGGPVFGKLGGLGARTFITALKCADALSFNFKPSDLEAVKEFNRIDRDLTQAALKDNYRRLRGSDIEPQEFEKDWNDLWEEKILTVSTRGVTHDTVSLKDALAEDNAAFRIEPIKLTSVASLISPVIKIFQLIMIYLVFRYLNAQTPLLTVIQFELLLSLLISSLLFSYHSHQNAEIPVIGIVGVIPEDLRKQFEERLEKLGLQSLRPTRVSVDKRYLSLIRDYFSALVIGGGLINAFSALLLVGLALLVGRIWQPGVFPGVLGWYKSLSFGMLLIPLGFMIGYYLTFLGLQYYRYILSPIVVGLLTAFLPYGLDYLLTGRLDLNLVRSSFVTLGTAISAALVASITSQVKKVIEGK